MAKKKGRGNLVGQSSEALHVNPFTGEVGSFAFGNEKDKAVFSEAGTTFEGGGAPISKKNNYDKEWER